MLSVASIPLDHILGLVVLIIDMTCLVGCIAHLSCFAAAAVTVTPPCILLHCPNLHHRWRLQAAQQQSGLMLQLQS